MLLFINLTHENSWKRKSFAFFDPPQIILANINLVPNMGLCGSKYTPDEMAAAKASRDLDSQNIADLANVSLTSWLACVAFCIPSSTH